MKKNCHPFFACNDHHLWDMDGVPGIKTERGFTQIIRRRADMKKVFGQMMQEFFGGCQSCCSERP